MRAWRGVSVEAAIIASVRPRSRRAMQAGDGPRSPARHCDPHALRSRDRRCAARTVATCHAWPIISTSLVGAGMPSLEFGQPVLRDPHRRGAPLERRASNRYAFDRAHQPDRGDRQHRERDQRLDQREAVVVLSRRAAPASRVRSARRRSPPSAVAPLSMRRGHRPGPRRPRPARPAARTLSVTTMPDGQPVKAERIVGARGSACRPRRRSRSHSHASRR